MFPYETVQRLATRCLIRYYVALFRFVIFLLICIHEHYANHLGTFIDYMIWRTKVKSATRCPARESLHKMMLTDQTEDGQTKQVSEKKDDRQVVAV